MHIWISAEVGFGLKKYSRSNTLADGHASFALRLEDNPFQLVSFSGTFWPCLARLFASRQDVHLGRCAFATCRRSRLDRI